MGQSADRNQEYMRKLWGTDKLATDYGSLEQIEDLEVLPKPIEGGHFSHGYSPYSGRMLREIANDDMTPKRHDFHIQNELHEKIRNDEDYDDWGYGTEPTYGK
jgi:hypothetical protein